MIEPSVHERVPLPASSAPKIALVTGASSGIGRAVAVALSHAGFRLYVVGRDPDRLASTVSAVQSRVPVTPLQIDLTRDHELPLIADALGRDAGRLDLLFHGAGIIEQAPLAIAQVEDLDRQYATNLRAPYVLTQRLLPLLVRARGDIVFVNSSAVLSSGRAEIGQYAATKHALRAIADSVRAEVNPMGVRVLSVYLGRTATPMQEAVFRHEQRAYEGDKLLQPKDVAAIVLSALALPRTAEVTDITIRPAVKT